MFCDNKVIRCVKTSLDSKKYSEYIRRGLSGCDAGELISSDWKSLDEAKKKLNDKHWEAEVKVKRLEALVAKAKAKIRRVLAQQQFLRVREKEMLRCGLMFLDKLNKTKEKEQLKAEASKKSPAPLLNSNAFFPVDWVPPSPENLFWSEIGLTSLSPSADSDSTVKASLSSWGFL